MCVLGVRLFPSLSAEEPDAGNIVIKLTYQKRPQSDPSSVFFPQTWFVCGSTTPKQNDGIWEWPHSSPLLSIKL